MEKPLHESVRRLLTAAHRVDAQIERLADLAKALNQSEQTINNWAYRGNGVSKQGRLLAQKLLGISAVWIEDGTGPEMAGSAGNDFDARHPALLQYPVNTKNFRCVYVIGRAQGGLPERIWTDGDYPVGATDEYAEIATSDPHAFLAPVVGGSMAPRFNPGEFALVEPGTEPEIEDDVLVRLVSGETMLKRLLSRRGGVRLGSYAEATTYTYQPDEISWMYYVAHPVPARKIKTRM
ncbi:S24 family peptidase [Burkholderia vietnamiensis]|uniref:S24 family peptidase n=1 Tax=Burkholderia vietnamiensis TaxID=60552 RepID=UPI0013F17124|nr:helix-turn-helix transcriptional regulator [Burkholderia vietnamiensis]HDR9026918.1 helix-turn-helix transcriptional regulator [Burkholderia vietnamiensis]